MQFKSNFIKRYIERKYLDKHHVVVLSTKINDSLELEVEYSYSKELYFFKFKKNTEFSKETITLWQAFDYHIFYKDIA